MLMMALFSWFNDSKQSPNKNQHTVLADKITQPSSSITWPVMKVLKTPDSMASNKSMQRHTTSIN